MSSATLAQPRTKIHGAKKWALVAGLALLALIAAGLFVWFYTTNQSNLPPVASLAEFEETSGIHPRMIAVTAGGGIVDFRFKIVDANRASQIMIDPELFPRLVVEESELVLNAGVHHLNNYEVGSIYFLFYPNVGSAVKTGTALSVMVGDTRYGPIIAK